MKSAPFCVERFSYTLKVVVASKSFRIPLCASTNENASISRKASAINRLSRTDGFVRRKHAAKKHRTIPVLFAGDPYGTRTHVTTVKGWCLNRLTMGPRI